MIDKTQIEGDVAAARANFRKFYDGPFEGYEIDAWREKVDNAANLLARLESSPAFAAQFDKLLAEYADAKSRADYFESEGGYSPETTPDWDAVNAARARLREFVIGESK